MIWSELDFSSVSSFVVSVLKITEDCFFIYCLIFWIGFLFDLQINPVFDLDPSVDLLLMTGSAFCFGFFVFVIRCLVERILRKKKSA